MKVYLDEVDIRKAVEKWLIEDQCLSTSELQLSTDEAGKVIARADLLGVV